MWRYRIGSLIALVAFWVTRFYLGTWIALAIIIPAAILAIMLAALPSVPAERRRLLEERERRNQQV